MRITGKTISQSAFVICASYDNPASPSGSHCFILWQDLTCTLSKRLQKMPWHKDGRIATKVEETAVVPSVSSLSSDRNFPIWKLILSYFFRFFSIQVLWELHPKYLRGVLYVNVLRVRVVAAGGYTKCKPV